MKSIQAIRKRVTQILDELKITEPPIPVEAVAHHLGANVKFSPFEGDDLAGMLIRGDNRIVIGVNSLHHPNRQRFTIAHECGHLLLHKGEVHVDHNFLVNRRDEESSLAKNPEEIEANRFAAELLMPWAMIQAELASQVDVEDAEVIREFARRYEVSTQAMTYRVANLLPLFA